MLNLQPTPDPELNEVLAALLDGVRPILAHNFVGAYLQGSFAVGDALPHSDVDFMFVVRSDVPSAQEAALQAVHVRVYDMASDWARHLEGSYFPEDLLRRAETAGQPLLYIHNGGWVLERSAHDNTLVVRWVLREHGVTLAGPAPHTLLEPVSAAALRREVYEALQAWGQSILAYPVGTDNDWAVQIVVLNICRMRQTLVTGQVHSKAAGADWATRTLDPRWHALIDRASAAHARQRLLGHAPADSADLAATLEFVAEAIVASQNTLTD